MLDYRVTLLLSSIPIVSLTYSTIEVYSYGTRYWCVSDHILKAMQVASTELVVAVLFLLLRFLVQDTQAIRAIFPPHSRRGISKYASSGARV